MEVLIAIPTYSGSVRNECVSSIIASLVDLCGRGIAPNIQFLQGNCYIALARNVMVTRFLASEATHLMFVDDDVTFPPDGISKLMEHDVELVGGMYPLKREEGGFPIRIKDAQPLGKLIDCEGIPTGFMCIKRELLERMIAAMPERKFTEPNTGEAHYDLFACERVDGVWWGEDYRFCQLAAEHGAKVWCDPSIEMSHIGTKAYRGDFNQWLIGRPNGGTVTRSGVAA